MSRKLVTAQAPFKMLVANLTGGSDPSRGRSGNPVKARSTFTQQHFLDIAGRGVETTPVSPKTAGIGVRMGHVKYTVGTLPVRATSTITVANNTFLGPTTIQLGDYVLTSDEDFVVGAGVNNTATNLAAAISRLPGYSAAAAAAIVTVSGLTGILGNEVLFTSGGSSPNNLTLSPTNGRMSGAEPRIGPPIIT